MRIWETQGMAQMNVIPPEEEDACHRPNGVSYGPWRSKLICNRLESMVCLMFIDRMKF